MSTSIIASPINEDGTKYRDKKRNFWPLSTFWPIAPMIGLYLAHVTGIAAFNWITLVMWYIAIPILDFVLGSDTSNPPESAVPTLENDRYYRYLTYITVPIHYVVMITGAWYVGTHDMPLFSILGLALSVGIINGLAINTGHELGHKKTTLERWLAKIVLAVVGYGHFYVEHNKGHHKHVSTPEDPASARFGENIYAFVLREIPGAWRRAWDSEKERLAKQGRGPLTLRNEVLQPLALTVVLYATLVTLFGVALIPFLIIQAAFGWWQLTCANYIEHYGLRRQKLADGRYERCQPHHSWNSNHVMSNLILFHLQRHSDHHAWPTRRYQSLRDFVHLPTLPSGYPGMFIAAMIPPLWRSLMDHRVLDLYGRDVMKLNIDPRKRERILREYSDVV